MHSKLVEALGVRDMPVAVMLTEDKPQDALQFTEGRWGCVIATLLAVSKGRTAVFDRGTFGCPGGGTGLGFGDQYTACRYPIDFLLASGNAEIAAKMRASSKMGTGERFFKSPEIVRRWLGTVPMTEIESSYVVMKPFDTLADDETPAVVVFLANGDQLSALAVMADYVRGSGEGAIARFGGACQSILYAYEEARRDQPRGVIGFFDISQRSRLDPGTLSFTVPWSLFQEMERNVEGSFLEMEDWEALRGR